MSAKNQSETSTALQEETADASHEQATEVESVEAVDETPAQTDGNTPDAVAEEQAINTEEIESGAEFKINDKRRSVREADDTPEAETDDLPSDAFEIDLTQLHLDSAALERELEEMRVKLKDSEARRDEAVKSSEEFADRFRKAQLQLRAETEEVRARMQRTFDQKLELARGDVVAGFLDTLDNLQRAVAAAEETNEQGAAFEALRDGVRATAEMFEAQLKKLGLQAVVSEGEAFNPEIHEAVELAVVPKEQDGIVIAELQRGYKFGDRLLRPARVKVGRAE
ncbi:MAG TPA: nucleotide exchange factor GrpE [Blastocatellia bacterium]|nr:nucleotide exchange factor GrpE [Blastocatellia bacterium]